MNIGILGTGDVGRVLGKGFADLGHDVKMGSREPRSEKVQAWIVQAGARASAGTFADAAAFGEVIVLATRWDGTEHAIRLANPASCAGKVAIDATNPLDFSQMPPRLAVGHTDSGGEQVQRWLPGAKVVNPVPRAKALASGNIPSESRHLPRLRSSSFGAAVPKFERSRALRADVRSFRGTG